MSFMASPDNQHPVPHLHRWSGSPFEIGQQHGQALRDEIINENGPAAHALAARLQLSLLKAMDRVLAIYEPLFQQHLPIAVEEIKGIAAGAKLSYSFAFYGAIRDGFKLPRQHALGQGDQCTSFVCGKAVTKNGEMLIGQTKDTGLSTQRYHLMQYEYSDGRRLIVLNYAGWIGNIALTSDGMAFTGNALYARETDEDTIPYSFLKRLVMEKSSVEEVLNIINGMRFGNGCFLLADASGKAVCLESVAGELDILDVSDLAFGHANSILCQRLKHYEDNWTKLPSSPPRQKNIQRLLDERAGEITVEDLKSIAADHTDFPFSICRHADEADPLSTSAAVVMDLTNREMHLALGKPCSSHFYSYPL
jgi:isopenicillin-N N-acyltransferase-like protein